MLIRLAAWKHTGIAAALAIALAGCGDTAVAGHGSVMQSPLEQRIEKDIRQMGGDGAVVCNDGRYVAMKAGARFYCTHGARRFLVEVQDPSWPEYLITER